LRLTRSHFALVAAAVFALILLGGLGIFIWQSEPEQASQESLAADFAKGAQFESGSGVTLDYVQALTWYRKAAAGGYAPAEYAIGEMTLAGRGVVRDERAAADWFLRAAEHGMAEAQIRAAAYLTAGTATADGKPDAVEALKWLLLAAEGVADPAQREAAVAAREKLSLQLSAEDRAEAERRAKSWRREHATR
jgi:uncharacterized protein